MDEIINGKFEYWDKNLENKELSKLKNVKLLNYFNDILKTKHKKIVIEGPICKDDGLNDKLLNSKLNINCPCEEINTKKHQTVNYKLKLLHNGAYNKIETFLLNNKEIISKVFFDHVNGGRVGLVHGGYLFFVLILNIQILIKEILNLSFYEYHLIKIKTSYKKKVPVNNLVIVKANFLNKNEIISKIIDSELEICTTVTCSIKIFKEISKF